MTSAGRILIIPKGDWKAETEYSMLDLVGHNGKVWLAKKNVVDIEPSIDDAEYWMDVIDLTKVNLKDCEMLSNKGGRETNIKGNQFFFANGRGRFYHSESPFTPTFIIQANDSDGEFDKNSSAIEINRGWDVKDRYTLLEHDENGNAKRYTIYGTHNKPSANDIDGLREFIKQVIAEG